MSTYKGIFIPELEIYKLVSTMVSVIREDLINSNNEQDTFLYKIFQNQKADTYDFFTQSKELYGRLGDDTRELAVRLFFDADRANLPTIHINLPSEMTEYNGLGTDMNFEEPEWDDLTGTYKNKFTRRFKANYQVIFSSSNSLEVILLYHSMRAAIIQAIPAMEVYGISNVFLGGQDLILNPEIIPPTVFVRGFTIGFSYDVTTPSLEENKFYSEIKSKISVQKE